MINRRTVFEIHNLKNQGCSSRSIATQLLLNRETVSNYLENPEKLITKRKKSSILEPYHEEIGRLLKDDQYATATVILQRIKSSGYEGEVTIVRDYLRGKRGKIRDREAFIRFESKPGEQMQIDWGHFGSLLYGDTKRKLYALAVIESHSRMLYVEFTHSQNQETLHRSLLNAFKFFGGTPKEIVVDNMITAVTERQGSLIRFNEAFLDFLRHFAILPKACNVRSPHEKGKIEKSIHYIKQNFCPLRNFNSLSDVALQLTSWLNEIANVRVHKTTGDRPIDRFIKESLRSLPELLPDCRERYRLKVHRDFAVRFDGNCYTTPPWTIGKQVTLLADHYNVTIYNDDKVVAKHERCWNRNKRIEIEEHKELVKKLQKKLWQDRTIAAFASCGEIARDYLNALSRANQPIKKNIEKLIKLKSEYGTTSLLLVIKKALDHKAYGADYVENILYQEMTPQDNYQPVKLKQDTLNNIRLEEPSLADYDAIVLKRRKKDD